MQDFKKYIVPFVDNEAMGCGFFIRDYFITAGHMFDESETHTIYYNGAYHTFNKADAVFLKSFKDGASDDETQDIAIFKFEGVDSPLSFSDKTGTLPNFRGKAKRMSNKTEMITVI